MLVIWNKEKGVVVTIISNEPRPFHSEDENFFLLNW